MIALKKLFDERHWEKIMPSCEAFRDAYFVTNVDVWAKYAYGEIDCDTLIVERNRVADRLQQGPQKRTKKGRHHPYFAQMIPAQRNRILLMLPDN